MAQRADGPLMLNQVMGNASEEPWHNRLHALEHLGGLETIAIPETESARKRMRVVTDRGRDCAIALPRDQVLSDGAVLYCRDGIAIVARIDSGARLRLVPHSVADALRLGHWCGNLHWKVVFGDGFMDVILDGPEQRYRDRLRDLAELARFDIAAPAE